MPDVPPPVLILGDVPAPASTIHATRADVVLLASPPDTVAAAAHHTNGAVDAVAIVSVLAMLAATKGNMQASWCLDGIGWCDAGPTQTGWRVRGITRKADRDGSLARWLVKQHPGVALDWRP